MPLKVQLDDTPTLNLTPMIDVMFQLIIFFMVATKFSEMERNIDVAVPQVAQAGDTVPPPRPLEVTVFADGHLELDGEPVVPVELTTRLAAARARLGNPSVVIRGDAQCEFQDVAEALAACREANIAELGITVRIAGRADGGSVR
jgi:biopolymer transport protein ExbD